MIIHGKELVMNEKEHAYFWGGAPVPGVTTILKRMNKPALIPWAVKMTRNYWLDAVKSGRTDFDKIHKESWNAHTRASKAAADIGTNVHSYAECYLKSKPLPELATDQAKRCVEAFHQWLEKHHVKILSSERLLFSKQYYYAGTCDLVAEIDGEMCVGDFKTSSGIWPDQRFQTAAYQYALEEEKNIKVPARWVIRFDKETGELETKKFTNFDLDFQGFSSILTLHRTLQTIEEE